MHASGTTAMRKSLWIFLLAVIIPSAVLGWLALRSAEEQKIILVQRTTELYKHETDALADAARSVVAEQRRGFSEAVRHLLAEKKPDELAKNFSTDLKQAWPIKAVGFTIGQDGRLLSPSPRAAANNADWQHFLWDHGSFLGGDIAATVYTVQVEALTQPETLRKKQGDSYSSNYNGLENTKLASNKAVQQMAAPNSRSNAQSKDVFGLKRAAPTQTPNEKEVLEMKLKFNGNWCGESPTAGTRMESKDSKDTAFKGESDILPTDRDKSVARFAATVAPAAPSAPPGATSPKTEERQQINAPELSANASGYQRLDVNGNDGSSLNQTLPQAGRYGQPQQLIQSNDLTPWSNVASETAEFRSLCQANEEGIVTRFVQDKLAMIFWVRPVQAPHLVFGCMIEALDLTPQWANIMPEPHLNSRESPDYVLALLDDKGRPVSTTPKDESGRDWKHPIATTEIREALPHWATALYLMRPEQLDESATGLRRTLTFFIVALLGAIALGGWLVVVDARRQFALAQQKTDFVSNVSHELKTPLTSIRMFAELMHGGRPEMLAKAPQYLRIIMVEAERLTRLINNVLDFAKLERRQKRFDKKPLDLHSMVDRIWESHELHLRESGFTTKWQATSLPLPVIGDEDALAQVLVNLLSNAEKYSGERKEVELHTYLDDHHVCMSVLDRGAGVPAGDERKIFEAFYRAHDSLSSGIQGSGLGLTLAQRLAQEHGGTIEYRRREGGGSAFTLKLPLANRDCPAS